VAYAIAHGGKYRATIIDPARCRRSHLLHGSHVPKDIWGHDYVYWPPDADHSQPRVICYGRDGVPGGVGDDADLDSLSLRQPDRRP
jgi:general secretion pathway protein G